MDQNGQILSSLLSSNYFTKSEINAAIANSHNIKIEVLNDGLPELDENNKVPEEYKDNIIYIVPQNENAPDIYDEYLIIDRQWELIGNTRIDLSDYLLSSTYASQSGQFVLLSSTNILGNNFSLNGDVKLYDHSLNTPSGLVQLDQNGKIPSSSYDGFRQKTISINKISSKESLYLHLECSNNYRFLGNLLSEIDTNNISNENDIKIFDGFEYVNLPDGGLGPVFDGKSINITIPELDSNKLTYIRYYWYWYDNNNENDNENNNENNKHKSDYYSLTYPSFSETPVFIQPESLLQNQKTISINKIISDDALYLHLEYSADPTFKNNVNELDTSDNIDAKIFDGFEYINLPEERTWNSI